MIKKFNNLFLLFLLCVQLVPFSMVFAETIEDTPTIDTQLSDQKDERIPDVSEAQSQVMQSSIEEAAPTYEDQMLLEKEEVNSSTPAVLIEEKSLAKEIVFRGKVTAGSEKQAATYSVTRMSGLILQRSINDNNWEDYYAFNVDENGVDLTTNDYLIDFSEVLTDPGSYRYRLVMDYAMEYFEKHDRLEASKKKASLELGTAEIFKETEETEKFEQVIDKNENATMIDGASSAIEESEKTIQSDEVEPLAPPPLEKSSVNIPTTANDSELPELQDNLRHAFQRGMGIMPMASPTVTPTITGETLNNVNNDYVKLEKPIVVSARYTSTSRVTMTLQLSWRYGNRTSNGISISQATTYIDQISYGFYTQMGGTYWGKTSSRTITGLLNRGHLEMQSGGAGGANGNLTNDFTNTRIINVEQAGSLYKYRSYNTTKMVFDNIPVGRAIRYVYAMNTPNGSGYYQCDYTFSAPNLLDLTAIAAPTFTATDHVTNSVTMNRGRYTGDVDDVTTDGQFRRTNDVGSWLNPSANLPHDTARNGYYHAYAVTGLTPGTQYHAYVSLKDVFGVLKSSGQTIFYTPNSVNTPSVTARGTPTTDNDATATLEGTYNVGASKPAHPSASAANVWVQISTNGSNWTTVSTSPSIDQSTRKVTYTLTGLTTKTTYWTRYAVKNASNAWSSWGTTSFKTKGVDLTIDTPTFDQSSSTDTSITMKEGSYAGDITQTNNQGRVEVTGNDGTDTDTPVTDLGHTVTTDGTYESKAVTGLIPGTRYRGTVAIKDFEDNEKYASVPGKWSDYFYTKAKAEQPGNPVLGTPSNMFTATADFTALYQAGDDTGKYTPAHPDDLEVEISTDDATWQAVTSSSSPTLASSQITTGTRTAEFSLENLRANTTYYVHYRVKNAGGWSAWSTSRQFVTLSPPAGLYIMDFPTFDFGMLQKQPYVQTAGLSTDSVKNHLVIDNSDMSIGWSLSVKLEPLKRSTDASAMPWATLRMDVNLQNTVDGGTSWNDYSTGVVGTPGLVTLNAGTASQTLWTIANPTDAQGTFRNEIDWSSVELDVPGNMQGYYQGKLVWSLDSVP